MLTTNQKGLIAETAVMRYDLVLDLEVQMLRVQCKWELAARIGQLLGR